VRARFIPITADGRFYLSTGVYNQTYRWIPTVDVRRDVTTDIREECECFGFLHPARPYCVALRGGEPFYAVLVTAPPDLQGMEVRSAYEANADLPVWLRTVTMHCFDPEVREGMPVVYN
jgi:hypothetical protein